MQILMTHPERCGNAVRVVLQPGDGEVSWRLLRNESGVFAGHGDPACFLVHEGVLSYVMDSRHLVNGVEYHYRAYAVDAAGVWHASEVFAATPNIGFEDVSVDAQEVVRSRLEVTLNAMLATGRLRATVPALNVMSVPFYDQSAQMPVVTVLFGGGSPAVHGLGDVIGSEASGLGGDSSVAGWLGAVSLDVSIWSLNADERNALRRGVQAAVAANLGVFAEAGLELFEVQSVTDTEDFQSMNTPVYQTSLRIGCQVPVGVFGSDSEFDDVSVQQWGL